MKVLVIGSGAREHALVWKLSQSPKVKSIFTAPGNAGTALIGENLNIKATDKESLSRAVKDRNIDLVVVGPEDPLAEGVVDYFQKLGVPIFGPTQAAAQLESSKAFAKDFMSRYNVPTAQSQTFSDISEARDYVQKKGAPLVIKADGLAAGKGVIMAETTDDALNALSQIMETRAFGKAGEKVVIEEKLLGREMSYFAVSDGKYILPMLPACDYKRVNDGDQGVNTGGMGSYSPPFFFTPELGEKVLHTVVEPVIKGMSQDGQPYKGVLYSGLMINNNQPKVIEFNARLGDPECQVILPRLKSDLLDIILGAVNGNLASVKPEWREGACVGVAMASGGYPGNYKTGLPITGLDKVDKDIMVFHAGTKAGSNPGEILTSGGRVLTVVAVGKNTSEAREKIYANISRIRFEGAHYRKDIAKF